MRASNTVRAALRALPSGALHVGGGLVVLGVTSYAFLLVSAHNLTPRGFASLSVLYVLVYTVGPGIFLPFEQEVGRALADRRVRGVGGGPVLRQAVKLALGVLATLILVVSLFGPIITRRLFDGSWLVFAGLLVSIVGLWAAHLSRGAFAGSGRFAAYGTELGAEGVTRILACLALAVLGVHVVGAYGMLLGGAFLASVLVAGRALRGISQPGPPCPWNEFASALAWLVAGSLLSQVLVNAGPVAVKLLATSADKQAAGQLLAGLVLARLPLFLFAAVQAALLPRLATLAGAGETAQFKANVRQLLFAVGGIAAAMIAVLALAGPPILHLLFGPRFNLQRTDLVILGLATGLFMGANVLSNALLALRRFATAAMGWAAGVAVLVAVISVSASIFPRVEWSFVCGAATSCVALAWLLRVALAAPSLRATTLQRLSDAAN